MRQRVVWILVALLCTAATSCNKKVKKAPATDNETTGQSLIVPSMPELAQASDEYGNEESDVTDYDYGTGDDLSSDEDTTGDPGYHSNDDSTESSDEESTSVDENDDDDTENSGW
jgi:hypothetical protein